MGRYKKINFFVGLFFCFSVLLFSVIGSGIDRVQRNNASVSVQSSDFAADFLEGFGWKIERKAVQITSVSLPKEFGVVYEEYNALQKKQGFDLLPYAGIVAEKRVYSVLNYPGLENDDSIIANVLIYKGKIIAADICCVRLGGFIHGVNECYNEKNQTG